MLHMPDKEQRMQQQLTKWRYLSRSYNRVCVWQRSWCLLAQNMKEGLPEILRSY